jgi:hypothetical protein
VHTTQKFRVRVGHSHDDSETRPQSLPGGGPSRAAELSARALGAVVPSGLPRGHLVKWLRSATPLRGSGVRSLVLPKPRTKARGYSEKGLPARSGR